MAAPTPTRQVIQNGNQNYVLNLSCLWDAMHTDPLAAYVLADPTATGDMGVLFSGNTLYPGTHLKIYRIAYDVSDGTAVQLYWDATTPTTAYIFNGTGSGKQMFRPQGGIFVPQSGGAPITGATGKLLLNTTKAVAGAGDFFSLEIWLRKDIQR